LSIPKALVKDEIGIVREIEEANNSVNAPGSMIDAPLAQKFEEDLKPVFKGFTNKGKVQIIVEVGDVRFTKYQGLIRLEAKSLNLMND
jgi:hypothetical protein